MSDTVQAIQLIHPIGTEESRNERSSTAPTSEAFDDWIRQYYEDVFYLALRIIGNSEEACDVTQDCFVKAFRARKNFRGECSPKTWLLRITVNACRDWLRRKKRASLIFLQTDIEPEEHAEAEVRFDPLAMDIKRCMPLLNDEQRTVLVLKFVEGHSFSEIGQTLRCSEAAAKMKVHRAKRRLKWLVEGGRGRGV